MGVMQCL